MRTARASLLTPASSFWRASSLYASCFDAIPISFSKVTYTRGVRSTSPRGVREIFQGISYWPRWSKDRAENRARPSSYCMTLSCDSLFLSVEAIIAARMTERGEGNDKNDMGS